MNMILLSKVRLRSILPYLYIHIHAGGKGSEMEREREDWLIDVLAVPVL